jgi:hypothetical protein
MNHPGRAKQQQQQQQQHGVGLQRRGHHHSLAPSFEGGRKVGPLSTAGSFICDQRDQQGETEEIGNNPDMRRTIKVRLRRVVIILTVEGQSR